MHTILFFRGVVIGLVLALPVGPVAAICVRRALADGGVIAFLTCLGAALADAILGVVAGYGLSIVSSELMSHRLLLRLVGGAFLIIFGAYTLRAAGKVRDTDTVSHGGVVRDAIAVFLLSMTNPGTLISAAGTSAAVGSLGSRTIADIAVLGSGIFLGSMAWWLGLAAGAGHLRQRLSPHWLVGFSRGIGVLLAVCGAVLVGGVLLAPQTWAYLLK